MCVCGALWITSHCVHKQRKFVSVLHGVHEKRPTILVVTWVTQLPTQQSIVNYTLNGKTQYSFGRQNHFVDGGIQKRAFYIHRVKLNDLIPEQVYSYVCGSVLGWSDIFTFRVLPDHALWSPRLAIFGDLGTTNNRILPNLIRQVNESQSVDMILHPGDFAYDMHTDDARVGDTFMRQIEPVAAHVPYMTSPGNHESAYNFSNYRARFTMPGGDGESLFYSFNLGPAHIISYSTEFYYFIVFGWKQLQYQYEWLMLDLIEANKPENRRQRPWIIVMAHRPMYCSNLVDTNHCDDVDNLARTGFPIIESKQKEYLFGLEELFYAHGVDVIISAHEHSYERMWPVYNRTVCNATVEAPYTNPLAPVHIVTGAAGSKEDVDPFNPHRKPWTAFRSTDKSFSRMTISNETHIMIDQISVENGEPPEVIDSVTIIRTHHGPDQYTCHEQAKYEMPPWKVLLHYMTNSE